MSLALAISYEIVGQMFGVGESFFIAIIGLLFNDLVFGINAKEMLAAACIIFANKCDELTVISFMFNFNESKETFVEKKMKMHL